MLPDHAHKRGHSRAHDLVSSLTQQILLGTFKPGDKLPSENTLVPEHGVSRTVVREALSKLQASGLVEPRHGIGTFVMERQAQAGLRIAAESAANVRDLLELRIGLEGQAAAGKKTTRETFTVIEPMRATGTGDASPFGDFSQYDLPPGMRSARQTTVAAPAASNLKVEAFVSQGVDHYDIPAFLRKQAD